MSAGGGEQGSQRGAGKTGSSDGREGWWLRKAFGVPLESQLAWLSPACPRETWCPPDAPGLARREVRAWTPPEKSPWHSLRRGFAQTAPQNPSYVRRRGVGNDRNANSGPHMTEAWLPGPSGARVLVTRSAFCRGQAPGHSPSRCGRRPLGAGAPSTGPCRCTWCRPPPRRSRCRWRC